MRPPPMPGSTGLRSGSERSQRRRGQTVSNGDAAARRGEWVRVAGGRWVLGRMGAFRFGRAPKGEEVSRGGAEAQRLGKSEHGLLLWLISELPERFGIEVPGPLYRKWL